MLSAVQMSHGEAVRSWEATSSSLVQIDSDEEQRYVEGLILDVQKNGSLVMNVTAGIWIGLMLDHTDRSMTLTGSWDGGAQWRNDFK